MRIVAYVWEQQTTDVVEKYWVAPMNQKSIPRLELQAAVYCSRLEQLIVYEHSFEIK